MKKTFCEICRKEITEKNAFDEVIEIKKKISPSKLTDFIIVGDIYTDQRKAIVCKYCFLDAIMALDDRPKLSDQPI